VSDVPLSSNELRIRRCEENERESLRLARKSEPALDELPLLLKARGGLDDELTAELGEPLIHRHTAALEMQRAAGAAKQRSSERPELIAVDRERDRVLVLTRMAGARHGCEREHDQDREREDKTRRMVSLRRPQLAPKPALSRTARTSRRARQLSQCDRHVKGLALRG
jgi:hypothetical protein